MGCSYANEESHEPTALICKSALQPARARAQKLEKPPPKNKRATTYVTTTWELTDKFTRAFDCN